MIISLIAAMAENRVIGNRGTIPWNLPADRMRFRGLTLGHPVLFGRITFEIIGRPLPGRKNIVMTHRTDYRPEGAVAAHSLDEVFQACANADEVFVCGGGTVFRETISLAQRIYLTVLHREVEGDVYFPEIPEGFVEVNREERDANPPFSYVTYERNP